MTLPIRTRWILAPDDFPVHGGGMNRRSRLGVGVPLVGAKKTAAGKVSVHGSERALSRPASIRRESIDAVVSAGVGKKLRDRALLHDCIFPKRHGLDSLRHFRNQ
jgi:hypothetical protein